MIWRKEKMANLKQLKEKWAFMLADKALLSMTSKQIVTACPIDYGPEVTDDHRSFIWDKLVDLYLDSDEAELFDMYDKFIQKGEDMVVMASPLMEDVADEITKELLNAVDADAMAELLEGYSVDEQVDDMLDSLAEDRDKDIKH